MTLSIILTTTTATMLVSITSFTSAATASITKSASSTSMANTIQPRKWEEMTEKEKQLDVLNDMNPYPCKAPSVFELTANVCRLAPIHLAAVDNSLPNGNFKELFLEKKLSCFGAENGETR